ncbi:MAG: response regulator transcription factor [Leptospiraceae bacterium]|nr:response regulator transcription factor [Leptospiraceae bacterium]MCB1304387.1 response regulator transcription factor [Leptospiraceae bacterium]
MILLVEDDVHLGQSIVELLELEEEQVEHVSTLEECRSALARNGSKFDIVLLDLMLPDGDGGDLIASIRSGSNATIIVMSAISENDRMVSTLREGADDYLTKPFEPDYFLAKLESIRRRSDSSQTTLEYNAAGHKFEVNKSRRSVSRDGVAQNLTSNEFDLFLHLLLHRGRSVDKSSLYQALGKEQISGDRLVDVHISKLRSKLQLQEEIKTIWGRGYMLADEDI